VLVALTADDGPQADDDRARLVGELFRPTASSGLIEELVSRSVALASARRQQDAQAALERLMRDHMRPAFLAEDFFTQRVAAAQIIGLLEDAVDAHARTREALDAQEADYRLRAASQAKLISTHGISPLVGDRQLGLPMDGVFVLLRARSAEADLLNWAFESLSYRERRVLQLRYGIGFSGKRHHTLDDVSRTFNVTREGIRQIESAAIRKLDILLQDGVLAEGHLSLSRTIGGGFSAADLLSRHISSLDLRQVLRSPRLVLQGDPGSGKSTVLQYVLWALSAKRSVGLPTELSQYLPLRIRAAEYATSLAQGQRTLEDFLIDSTGRFAQAAERAILGGRALVLLDGLDEVAEPTLRTRVMNGVNEWLSDPLYAANRAVITTRIVGYVPQGPLSELPHLRLEPLSDDQIEHFARGWYAVIGAEMPLDVESETRELVRQIRVDSQVLELARNPLLLTILALLRRRGGRLPNQRARLYSSALDTLVHTWPLGQRGVEIEPDLVPEWLEPLALAAFEESDAATLADQQVQEILVQSLRELKDMTELEARRETRTMLAAIQQHTGLLAVRGQDADGHPLWAFLHRTFIEYLLARRMATQWQTSQLDLRHYIHRSRWQIVLLLMAGQLALGHRRQVGPLLDAIRQLDSEHEDLIGRDLLLAVSLLADGVPAAPAETVSGIIRRVVQLWRCSPIRPLRKRTERLLERLSETEYGAVAAREALALELQDEELLILAGCLGPSYFSTQLMDLMRHGAIPMQARAALLLLAVRPDTARGHLSSLMGELNPDLVIAVARPLGQHEPEVVCRRLLQLIRDPDGEYGLAALDAVATLPASVAQPTLLKLLEAIDGLLAGHLEEVLATFSGIEGQLLAIGRRAGPARWRALRILRQRRDPRWRDAVQEALMNPDIGVRLSAAIALVDDDDLVIGDDVFDVLDQALEDENDNLRLEAAYVLAQSGWHHERAIEVLSQQATEGHLDVRVAAATGLAEDMDHVDTGVAALIALTAEDLPANIRHEAAIALSFEGTRDSAERLIELVNDPDEELAFSAASALAMVGSRPALERMMRWLTDPRSPFGQRAVDELARWYPPMGLMGLWSTLHDVLLSSDLIVRQRIATLLPTSPDPQTDEIALMLLGDTDPVIRVGAMRRLSRSKESEIHNAVRDRLGLLLADSAAHRVHRPTDTDPISVADLAYLMIDQQQLLEAVDS
jgi:HEAT repeat protein